MALRLDPRHRVLRGRDKQYEQYLDQWNMLYQVQSWFRRRNIPDSEGRLEWITLARRKRAMRFLVFKRTYPEQDEDAEAAEGLGPIATWYALHRGQMAYEARLEMENMLRREDAENRMLARAQEDWTAVKGLLDAMADNEYARAMDTRNQNGSKEWSLTETTEGYVGVAQEADTQAEAYALYLRNTRFRNLLAQLPE